MLNVGAFRFLSSSPELRNSPESHQRAWTSLHPPIEVQIPIKDPIQKHSRSLWSSFKKVRGRVEGRVCPCAQTGLCT